MRICSLVWIRASVLCMVTRQGPEGRSLPAQHAADKNGRCWRKQQVRVMHVGYCLQVRVKHVGYCSGAQGLRDTSSMVGHLLVSTMDLSAIARSMKRGHNHNADWIPLDLK